MVDLIPEQRLREIVEQTRPNELAEGSRLLHLRRASRQYYREAMASPEMGFHRRQRVYLTRLTGLQLSFIDLMQSLDEARRAHESSGRDLRSFDYAPFKERMVKVIDYAQRLWKVPAPARTKLLRAINLLNRWPRALGWVPSYDRSYVRLFPPEPKFETSMGGWGSLEEFRLKLAVRPASDARYSPESTARVFQRAQIAVQYAVPLLLRRALGRKLSKWDRLTEPQLERLRDLVFRDRGR